MIPAASVSAHRLAALLGPVEHLRLPLYAGLAAAVRGLVADGRLPVGARLPAERELAAATGLSRATATAAYRRLREDGWATARQGAGTFTALPGGSGAVGAWVPQPPVPGVLDLVHAAPAGPPAVAEAFTTALDALPRLLPGHGYLPEGLPELRVRIADRFTARGLPTSPEQVLVTPGATGGISAALAALAGPGERVLVEHPTWPSAMDAVDLVGARVVPVAVDADDTGAFVAAADRAARATAPRAAFFVPDSSNPTGATLSLADREHLAASLQGLDVVAVADETLSELVLDGQEPPPPFAASARPGHVVTVGSLSKSVWAGLRIGWLRAERPLLQPLAATLARRQISVPVLDQLAACTLLDRLDDLLVDQRARLARQRDALAAAVRAQLPGWGVPVPAGGQSLWCALPRGTSSTALVEAAGQRGLRLAPGPRFGTGHSFDDRLRLPFTEPVDVLERAVAILAAAAADEPGGRRRGRRDEEALVV